MIYAYAGKPSLRGDWHIEEIEAYTLTEARGKYKELRKKYKDYAAHTLLGGASLEAIQKAYEEKWY